MRGKLARFFAYLTAFMLIAALATPWFQWENEAGFIPNGGDRALCWIDATCRTNSDVNTLIFKGGYRAQRFYDATLMLLVIPAVLCFLPLIALIHALNNRSSTNSRLTGGLARALIVLLGLITLLAWIAAVILFPLGVKNRYRPCDFQSNIPQWGCAGPNQGEPAENQKIDDIYGHRDLVFPIVIETVNPDGTRNFTQGYSTQHVEWAVLSGWYFALLAPLFLIPTILCGLLMRNKKQKVVTQTTTNTAVKEQYIAPSQQVGRAPAVAVPTTGYAQTYAPATTGYVPNNQGYSSVGPATRV